MKTDEEIIQSIRAEALERLANSNDESEKQLVLADYNGSLNTLLAVDFISRKRSKLLIEEAIEIYEGKINEEPETTDKKLKIILDGMCYEFTDVERLKLHLNHLCTSAYFCGRDDSVCKREVEILKDEINLDDMVSTGFNTGKVFESRLSLVLVETDEKEPKYIVLFNTRQMWVSRGYRVRKVDINGGE